MRLDHISFAKGDAKPRIQSFARLTTVLLLTLSKTSHTDLYVQYARVIGTVS